MPVNNLNDLLIEQLRDLYDAEKQLVRALPKMAKAATSDGLESAIREHLAQTKEQVVRLEQAFEQLGRPAKGKPCKAMQGLIEEGAEAMQEEAEEPFRDLAIIAAAQKVEHYEMSGYGTASAVAKRLGREGVVGILDEIQAEESDTDAKLTELAESLMADFGVDGEETGEEEIVPVAKRTQPIRGTGSTSVRRQ